LNESPRIIRPRIREGLISAVSVGFFFLLIGAMFVVTPSLFDKVQAFFNNFTTTEAIPHLPNVFVPVPANPATHTVVYTAVWQFSVVWTIFQIIILAFRFVVGSPIRKKAETVGNLVFWVGAAYLISTLLTSALLTGPRALENWFVFWAAIIMLIGLSIIVRAIILATRLAVFPRFSDTAQM
jgi:hypothetical protein